MRGGGLGEDCCEERFFPYDFLTGETYGLSEEVLKTKKRVRGVDGAFTTAILTDVKGTFCAGVLCTDLGSIWQTYDDDQGQSESCVEANFAGASELPDFGVVFDRILQWSGVGVVESVTEKVLSVAVH